MNRRKEIPRLEELPAEVLEQVAYFTAISPTSSDLESIAILKAATEQDQNQNQEDFNQSEPHQPQSLPLPPPINQLPPAGSALAVPPSNLLSLLLLSHHFYSLLSLSSNPRVYAKIFKHKFDTAAIERRYGKDAVNSFNLAEELVRRCVRFKRMRLAVSLDTLGWEENEEDRLTHLNENLWTAYMCLVENGEFIQSRKEWSWR